MRRDRERAGASGKALAGIVAGRGCGEGVLHAGVEEQIRFLGDTEVSKQVLGKSLGLAVGELL